jgi:transcriptional regulator with XRE-family HTH domain
MAENRGIGPRIAEARHAAGLTQLQLAERTGSTQRAVQSWELGLRHPRLENLRALAAALEQDVSWFYADEPKAAA